MFVSEHVSTVGVPVVGGAVVSEVVEVNDTNGTTEAVVTATTMVTNTTISPSESPCPLCRSLIAAPSPPPPSIDHSQHEHCAGVPAGADPSDDAAGSQEPGHQECPLLRLVPRHLRHGHQQVVPFPTPCTP